MGELDPIRRLAVALLLGALVGLQREQARSRLGGVRTFPLVALFGAFAGMLSARLESALPAAAGLLAVTALAWIGNRGREGAGGGLTTEVALLATFALGAYVVEGPLAPAVVAGGAVAVLLQFKPELHGAVRRLSAGDVRAVMRLAVLALIVLPVLPDRAFGPSGTLNPRETWTMVVLVVGINLGGYIAYKFAGGRGGVWASGLLGGLISSTAVAYGQARLAAGQPKAAPAAAAAVLLACVVVYPRAMAELAVVSPEVLRAGAAPLALAGLAAAAAAAWTVAAAGRDGAEVEPRNPGSVPSALVFGGLYALVGLGLALSRRELQGTEWLVAAASGLTDVDAVVLSSARLAKAGALPHDEAWRMALGAVASNNLFKAGLATAVSGRTLARRAGLPLAAAAAAAGGIAAFWPR